MSHTIIVSYNSANPKEIKFVTKLADYLNLKNIYVDPYDPNVAAQRMRQQLLNAKWFVLILTPEAIRSPQVQSLVNTAFGYIKQGQMQGVLAIASSSNPVELEDLPPLWSTIRIYYTGERNEDLQQSFEKLSRTLDDTRATVPVATSSTNNWASSFSSVASRPQPTIRQPAQSSNSRLIIPVVATLILIIFFLAFIISTFLIPKLRATSTPTSHAKTTIAADQTSTAIAKANAKASAVAHANATVTAQANATATALSQLSTLKPQELYTKVATNSPTYLMNAQNSNQNWDQQIPLCTFTTNNTYQISNGISGQYTPCMARNIKLKNFAYQVMMTISSSGDTGGLIFRADDSLMTFYRLSLDSQGMYKLYLCQTCTDSSASGGDLLQKGKVSVNTLGQPNKLTVIAIKADIFLYINQNFVEKLDGSAITNSGEMGLFGVSQNQSTNVTFSDVKVWKL